MNSQEQKEQKERDEFLEVFEVAYHYLSATDKTALVTLAATWASQGIAQREAAANAQGART